MHMQWNWILFSFLAIYFTYSNALVCFVCQNCANPADLTGFTNNSCPGPCMKITTYIPTRGTYIYKACTTICTPEERYFGGAYFNVKCCNNMDRCNSGERTITSKQLFMTSLPVMLSFFRLY